MCEILSRAMTGIMHKILFYQPIGAEHLPDDTVLWTGFFGKERNIGEAHLGAFSVSICFFQEFFLSTWLFILFYLSVITFRIFFGFCSTFIHWFWNHIINLFFEERFSSLSQEKIREIEKRKEQGDAAEQRVSVLAKNSMENNVRDSVQGNDGNNAQNPILPANRCGTPARWYGALDGLLRKGAEHRRSSFGCLFRKYLLLSGVLSAPIGW